MSTSNPLIVALMGQFAVDLGAGPVLFKAEADAQVALSEYQDGAAQREEAADFCAYAHPGLAPKAVAGKSNVIVAYMQWVDLGRPEPKAVEADVEEEEADI